MTWLLPSALVIAAAGVVAAIALHFIARSRPLAEPLPTARFVPRRPVQARTRSFRLSDVALLVLRALAITAIGIAIAGPMFASNRRASRIILADRSRAVAAVAELRDSVRLLMTPDAAVIAFDTTARSILPGALDTLGVSAARGSLSAALAAAIRVASTGPASADSIELVLVSPLVREELDSATARIRASWPGRIRVVRLRPAPWDTARPSVEARGSANDAVVAGLSLAGVLRSPASVRVVRHRLTSTDSAWARGAGHVLVHWPESDADAEWTRRDSIDAIGAAASAGGAIISRFPRLWMLRGTAVARWADGEPAAVEHSAGDGCVRDLGILVDEAGDLTLRAPFRAFVAPLLAPCGGVRDVAPIEPGLRASITGAGGLASAVGLRNRETSSSRWAPWLLALAALLLTVELRVRRSGHRVA